MQVYALPGKYQLQSEGEHSRVLNNKVSHNNRKQ